MPLRNQRPYPFVPEGLTDAVDGSVAFAGAMYSTQNMIRQVNTKGVFVPRPGMTILSNIPDYGGGPVTALLTVGNVAYGMCASAAFPGRDRPFVLNLATNAFSTITGLSSTNLPISPNTVGDLTIPTIAEIGGRVIFTHPGFAGGVSRPPVFLTFQGTTHGTLTLDAIGPPLVQLNFDGQIPQIGQQIIGPNIAPGTTIFAINAAGTAITLSTPATGSAVGSQFFVVASPPAVKFGWLDIGGFSAMISATTFNGVPALIGNFSTLSIQPGMQVTGSGIPANTVVTNVTNLIVGTSLDNLVGITVTSGMTSASILVINNQMIGSGMLISGVGIPVGTSISGVSLTGVDNTHTIYAATLSLAATQTLTNSPVFLTGALIALSLPATASASAVAITIAGGSLSAPLWSAGDLGTNPIASNTPPIFVVQFNNRAWYGVNTGLTSGVQASDAGLSCIQTNITQTLTFSDNVPVTAASGLALFNQLGGIVQSLMIFQGASNIRQITGDFSTQNISVNSLLSAVGTVAPNSIASTPKGLLFISADGMRLIDFDARVSDPIGVDGQGLTLPFINSVTPSRMAAAYNENVYRVTVIWMPPTSVANIWGSLQRTDEFWFHLTSGKWSGPHTCTCDQIAAFPSVNSFIAAPLGGRGALYRSDPQPLFTSVYREFNNQLACVYQTALMPDNEQQMAVLVIESTIFTGLLSGSEEILVTGIDDMGQTLDQNYIVIGPFSTPAQRMIAWDKPLVFRQLMIKIEANASPQLQLGVLNLRHQILGYQLAYPVAPEFILGSSVLGGRGSAVAGP